MNSLHFSSCNSFGLSFSFDRCLLNHSTFYKTRIIKTEFSNCNLNETDFTACDLTGSVFEICDLAGAVFEKTILAKVDFRTAFNFTIDPENNRLKKQNFHSIPSRDF